MMHVLLFVLHVSMVGECAGNAGVGNGGDVVVVSAGQDCVGGTRIVCNAADVLGMRGVGAM